MKHLILAGFWIFICTVSYAQDFRNTFEKLSAEYVPERVHLHFDKTTYGAGDTIWFKAYLLEGIVAAGKCRSLYIDWTDQNGKMITRTVSPVSGGITYGQIEVPVEYESDFIHVKAYTKWMMNFDSSFLYNQDIRIVSKKTSKVLEQPARTTFKLFPESGNLIAGLNNKVAFKATDQYGRPVNVSGHIMKNGVRGDEIKTIHDGMGYFFVNPEAGANYAVFWKDEQGKENTTSFPATADKGLLLQISDSGDNKKIVVLNNDPDRPTVHIIGSMYQQSVFNISKELVNTETIALVPTSTLPSGILTVTVLDQNFHPLAERITFLNNGEYRFETELNVEHWGLNKRAKDIIELSIPDNMVANLSVSVTDNQIDFDTSHSIITDFLLSSELKGKIYNPAFYFSDEGEEKAPLIDLVMLTNGWRKISWTDLAQGKLPEIKYPADTVYQTISGKIYGATPAQLQSVGDIILIVNQKEKNEWVSAAVNPDGTFSTDGFILFDTATVYFQPPKGPKMNNVSVQFMQDKLPVQSTTHAGIDEFIANPDTSGMARHATLSEILQDELKFFRGKVLEDITITAPSKSKEEILDEKYTSGMFSGGMGRGFDLRNEPGALAYQNIFQFLQGRIAGVNISMTNPPTVTWRGGAPALFLDEMPVDADMLSNIPVSDIAYVKALTPPFMGASGGANGAIAIYTRRGDDVEFEPGKGLSRNALTGYSVIREFYVPNYDRMEDEKKDLRTTLYWNPAILLTPDNPKVQLTFFNNDVSQEFRVVVEGMTPEGKLTRLVYIMW